MFCPPKREEVNQSILGMEHHLTITAEKLRMDMSDLTAYFPRAEKHLDEQRSTKVAADMKLPYDIKKFGRFRW